MRSIVSKLFTPVAVACLFFCPRCASGQSSGSAAAPASSNPVIEMHLMTPSTGWAWAGEHILWTDTAGQIWTDITPPLTAGQMIDGVYFLDAEHGWTVLNGGGPSELPAISVAITADAGNSWSIVPLLENAFPQYSGAYLSFVNDTRGWMLLGITGSSAFSGANLFTTSDGGKTWSALHAPPIDGEIHFFSDSTGSLVGGVHRDELYRTRDGGQTWARKVIPLPEQVKPYTLPQPGGGTYVTNSMYKGPYFQTEQKATLVVIVHVAEDSMDLLTYSTDDGGDTWQLQNVNSDRRSMGTLAFFDSTYMEVASIGGIVSFRRDSDKTGARLSVALPNKHSAVQKADFLDAQHGWLLISDGSLVGTADGGNTLTVLLRPKVPLVLSYRAVLPSGLFTMAYSNRKKQLLGTIYAH